MKDKDILDLVRKAKESFNTARSLFENGYYDFSVSRLYYAMFYCAEALLLTKNLSFSKHSAVISALGKEFVKTGEIPATLHQYILDAFNIRQIGDYGAPGSVSKKKRKCYLKKQKNL